MKTIETLTVKPKLEIFHDESCESPRTSMSNIGHMVIVSNKYSSPDPNYVDVVSKTGDRAKNLDNHMELIKAELEEEGIDVLFIFPISTYEHGGISYFLGSNFGFDYSNNGFYIVTRKLAEAMVTDLSEENVRSIVESEIKTYGNWANGDVYGFTLYDNDGEVADTVCGFYDVDDIASHLPEEWENEDLSDYMK